MRRMVAVAAIVVFVVAGVTWALAAHHGTPVPSLGSVSEVGKVVSGISKDLPKVGKCLDGGDPTHIAKCVGKQLPRIPGLGGGIPGFGNGLTTGASQARYAVRRS